MDKVTTMQSVLLLWSLLLGCTVLAAAAPPAASAPTVMALGGKYDNISQALQLINSSNPDLAAYLGNPKTVCTFFAPSNKAMTDSMRSLGKYVGIASQNETLQNITFNYHVVPGKALTVTDLMNMNQTQTRANEPLWILHLRGEPFIYSRPDYPVALKQTDIKAGGCMVHTIDLAMVPPSAIPQIQEWLVELNTLPPPPPKADWGRIVTPLHAELAAESEKRLGLVGNTTSKGTDTLGSSPKGAEVPGAAATTTAKSSAGVAAAGGGWIALGLAVMLLLV